METDASVVPDPGTALAEICAVPAREAPTESVTPGSPFTCTSAVAPCPPGTDGDTPFTANVVGPDAAAAADAVSVRIAPSPPLTGEASKVPVTPGGRPLTLRETGSAEPPVTD